MIGRSHGIHAEPITLGLVFAGFHAEIVRHRGRLVGYGGGVIMADALIANSKAS